MVSLHRQRRTQHDAEARLNVLGQGKFKGYGAGNFPSGQVQPIAAEMAAAFDYHEPLCSKS